MDLSAIDLDLRFPLRTILGQNRYLLGYETLIFYDFSFQFHVLHQIAPKIFNPTVRLLQRMPSSTDRSAVRLCLPG